MRSELPEGSCTGQMSKALPWESKHFCTVTTQLPVALGMGMQVVPGGTDEPPKKPVSPLDPLASLRSSVAGSSCTKMTCKKAAPPMSALAGITTVSVWSGIAGFWNVSVFVLPGKMGCAGGALEARVNFHRFPALGSVTYRLPLGSNAARNVLVNPVANVVAAPPLAGTRT